MNGNKLFLDIEWAKFEERGKELEEIVEMAGILLDHQGEVISSKLNYIQPKHLDKIENNTLSLLKIKRKDLEKERKIASIFNEFFGHFQDYQTIVLWNKNAYNLLLREADRIGYTFPAHKLLVLQDLILDLSGRKLSFDKAIRFFEVEYDPRRYHESIYDVYFLKELYLSLIKFLKSNQQEDKAKLYHTIRSKVVHYVNCGCKTGARITTKNKEYLEGGAMTDGYRLCKYCRHHGEPVINIEGDIKKIISDFSRKTPEQLIGKTFREGKEEPVILLSETNNHRLAKKIVFEDIPIEEQFTDRVIAWMCSYYKLSYNISNGVIFVRTNFSSWRIYHDYKCVNAVMHESLWKDYNQSNKYKSGYHQQKYKYKKLSDVLRYISYHDRDTVKKMVSKDRKDHIYQNKKRDRWSKKMENKRKKGEINYG